MNARYLKIILEKELYNAAHSISGMSDYATKEEIMEYINDSVTERINNVLKEFDIKQEM